MENNLTFEVLEDGMLKISGTGTLEGNISFVNKLYKPVEIKKVYFSDIFFNTEYSIKLKKKITIYEDTYSPGIGFSKDLVLCGIPMIDFMNFPIQVEVISDNHYKILGVYK